MLGSSITRVHDAFNKELSEFKNWYDRNNWRLLTTPCASECASQRNCLKSGYDEAAVISRKLSEGCDSVYYTVGLHRKQTSLKRVDVLMDPRCYIAFVKKDSPLGKYKDDSINGWNIVRVASSGFHRLSVGRRASRIPKISPELFFAKTVRYAVYFDSALIPLIKPQDIRSYMVVNGEKVVIAMHAHRYQMGGKVRSPMVSFLSYLVTS